MIKKALLGLLLITLGCTKNVSTSLQKKAPVTFHKVKRQPLTLPTLIKEDAQGRHTFKPSVWNQKTLRFSEGMPQKITVKKGDSVYSLSRQHSVPISLIIKKNKLTAPFTIYPHQTLILVSPRLHITETNQNLYSIAMLHKVDVSSLARQNNLKAPYKISPGQALTLPASTSDKPFKALPSLPSPRRLVFKPAPRAGKLFLKPVQGQLISSFGSQGKGLFNDGINLAAPKGTSIKSAENGVVVYCGRDIKSFGNLVLIKHSGGWLTAYGHLEKIKVQKGDSLKKGQSIGTVGQTGIVKEPQLHFELRKGKKPVNPLLYLIA